MRVAVIGTGYVGLVSGVCLAERGHDVVCVDVDAAKVERILAGQSPIHEDGLADLIRKNLGRRFTASTDLRQAVLDSEVTLIAVGTPFDGRTIDLTAVRQVAAQIGAVLRDKRDYHVVVVKSTVVPGTTDSVVQPALEAASGRKAGTDFGVGMNPEFLTEGQAVRDFLQPDRIVLGALDARALGVLEELYAGFEGVPKLRTNLRTAEMIKYASNALLATMISFSNELANLGAALGDIDVVDVLEGVHASSYLSVDAGGRRLKAPITSFLGAGCGYGGSCLPKDVNALVAHGEAVGAAMPLLRAVTAVNDAQPAQIRRILERHFPKLAGLQVGVLGLAFKPDTDDVRESPAFPIVRSLLDAGAVVTAFDPVAMPEARKLLPEGTIAYAKTLEECVAGRDAVVLVTRWKQFESLPHLLKALPRPPLLVDGRRQLGKESVARYAGIGLAP